MSARQRKSHTNQNAQHFQNGAQGWDTGDVDPPTCIAVNSGQSHITALSRHTDTHSRYSRSGTRESVRLVGIASTDKGIELVMMRDATSILTHNERAHNRRATCAIMFPLVSTNRDKRIDRAQKLVSTCMF